MSLFNLKQTLVSSSAKPIEDREPEGLTKVAPEREKP
jgi:hypothetical protein